MQSKSKRQRIFFVSLWKSPSVATVWSKYITSLGESCFSCFHTFYFIRLFYVFCLFLFLTFYTRSERTYGTLLIYDPSFVVVTMLQILTHCQMSELTLTLAWCVGIFCSPLTSIVNQSFRYRNVRSFMERANVFIIIISRLHAFYVYIYLPFLIISLCFAVRPSINTTDRRLCCHISKILQFFICLFCFMRRQVSRLHEFHECD